MKGGVPRIDDERLRLMWAADMTPPEIAVVMGVTPQAINGRVRKLGLRTFCADGRARNGGRPRLDLEEAIKLRESGLSHREIAERFGVSLEWVRTQLNRLSERPKGITKANSSLPELPTLTDHPFWTPERDALVWQTQGCAEKLSAVAKLVGRSIADTFKRWHVLRAGAK